MRFLVLIPLLLASWVAHGADFRNASWGDSQATVVKSEHRKPDFEKPDQIIYYGKLAGMNCAIVFEFNKHGLSRGIYNFSNSYSNPQLYLNDYSKIDGLLTKKYGAGKVHDEWHNENPLFKETPSNYGIALQLGQLTKKTVWEHGDNVIIHHMEYTGEYINHTLIYESKKTKMSEDKATMNQL